MKNDAGSIACDDVHAVKAGLPAKVPRTPHIAKDRKTFAVRMMPKGKER
jgi:hypothetical protein